MKHLPSQIQTWFRSSATVLAIVATLAAANVAFGAKKDPTDVTAKVAAAVKDESLSITAGNTLFGDTAPGVPKKLSVEFGIGEDTSTREVGENGRLEIAAPAGKRLTILKANYGPADGSKPVNVADLTENSSELLDTLPGFEIEHVLTADGAKNGSWISMAKDPKGRLLLGGQGGQPITRVTLKDGKVITWPYCVQKKLSPASMALKTSSAPCAGAVGRPNLLKRRCTQSMRSTCRSNSSFPGATTWSSW